MGLKGAFIFIAPNADPQKHRSVIETEQVTLISVGVVRFDLHPGLENKNGDEIF